MFKKFTALLLITAFTNVYAITPFEQSRDLSKTFDSLNYKLNVEWDQKDGTFFDESIAGFEKEIASLQKDGLTKEELVQYTLDKIKDKEIRQEVSELSKIISESQMTNEEARAFTISKLNSTYSHGASWSGSRMGFRTAFIIGAIIVILICMNQEDETPKPKDHCYPRHDNYEYGFTGGNNGCYNHVM